MLNFCDKQAMTKPALRMAKPDFAYSRVEPTPGDFWQDNDIGFSKRDMG